MLFGLGERTVAKKKKSKKKKKKAAAVAPLTVPPPSPPPPVSSPPSPPQPPTCTPSGGTCSKANDLCCDGHVCTSRNVCLPTVATRQPCTDWEQCYHHPGSFSDLCSSSSFCGTQNVCLNSEGSRCNNNCDCIQGLCCLPATDGLTYCKIGVEAECTHD
jgi:hypothetical protein